MKKNAGVLLLMVISMSLFSQTKTGTLKIFSELSGISVYVDEKKQTTDITSLIVPVGSHYLKVLLGTVTVYSEIVEIKENAITTVLIKNTGQTNEKIMNSKITEREEYNNSKVDVIFSSNSVTQTTGKSAMFPGYYGYYGYSKSNSVTTQEADFKIIQGGIKEISDVTLAKLAGNTAILNQNAADNLKSLKMVKTGSNLLIGGILIGGIIIADASVKKPFLHKPGTDIPAWEIGTLTGCLMGGVIGYFKMDHAYNQPAHYYRVDDAAKDAQMVNKKLKEKLGLPENYDIK